MVSWRVKLTRHMPPGDVALSSRRAVQMQRHCPAAAHVCACELESRGAWPPERPAPRSRLLPAALVPAPQAPPSQRRPPASHSAAVWPTRDLPDHFTSLGSTHDASAADGQADWRRRCPTRLARHVLCGPLHPLTPESSFTTSYAHYPWKHTRQVNSCAEMARSSTERRTLGVAIPRRRRLASAVWPARSEAPRLAVLQHHLQGKDWHDSFHK